MADTRAGGRLCDVPDVPLFPWGAVGVETEFVKQAGKVGLSEEDARVVLGFLWGGDMDIMLPVGVPEALFGSTWLELANCELEYALSALRGLE